MLEVAAALALILLPLGLALSLSKGVLAAILHTAGGRLQSYRKDGA